MNGVSGSSGRITSSLRLRLSCFAGLRRTRTVLSMCLGSLQVGYAELKVIRDLYGWVQVTEASLSVIWGRLSEMKRYDRGVKIIREDQEPVWRNIKLLRRTLP